MGGGAGTPPELHYIEEGTQDALKQNTFIYEGYSFEGWLYEEHLYDPGQKVLMPGRNMEALAKWSKDDDPEIVSEEKGNLDQIPKTGNGEDSQSAAPQTNRMELYINVRKKENEQNTED